MSAESNARSHVQSFAWWVGAPDLTADEATIRDLAAIRDAADELIRETIQQQRGLHAQLSWSRIGAALGTTRQAAQQRYGRS